MRLISETKQDILAYPEQWKNFDRDAKLLLVSQLITSISFGVYWVFFNIYLKKGGLGEDLIGLISSAGMIATIFVAIPTGLMVSRIGAKKSFLISLPIIIVSGIISSLVLDLQMLIFLSIIGSIGSMIFNATTSPYLSAKSSHENRHYLFSLSFAINSIMNVIGTLFGGLFPDILSSCFGFSEFVSLRITLASAGFLSLFALFPISAIKDVRFENSDGRGFFPRFRREEIKKLIRFPILSLIVALGAGLMVPYFSLYFSDRFGLKPTYVGYVFSASSVITGLAVLVSPILVKKFGKLYAMIIPQSISLPFILLLAHSRTTILSVLSFWLRGALMNMSNPVINQMMMEETSEEKRPIITNINTLCWNGGWGISVAISGVLIKNTGYTISFYLTFSIYVIYIISLYIFFRRKDNDPKERFGCCHSYN